MACNHHTSMNTETCVLKLKHFRPAIYIFLKKLVIMELKQSNIKDFFTYGFSSLLFLHAEDPGGVDSLEVKGFGPKGRKFLATKKFMLATKSKNLGASWPQGFFSRVEPWCCHATVQ